MVRLLVDKYTDIDMTSIITNYTVENLTVIHPDETQRTGRTIDIQIPRPIIFQDFILLNFSLVVDAFSRRTDSTPLSVSVITSVLCIITSHGGYPPPSTYIQCSDLDTLNIPLESFTCRLVQRFYS